MSGRTRTPGAAKALLEGQPQAKPSLVNVRKKRGAAIPRRAQRATSEGLTRFAATLAPLITDLQTQGYTSVRKLADALEARGACAQDRGGRWAGDHGAAVAQADAALA